MGPGLGLFSSLSWAEFALMPRAPARTAAKPKKFEEDLAALFGASIS